MTFSEYLWRYGRDSDVRFHNVSSHIRITANNRESETYIISQYYKLSHAISIFGCSFGCNFKCLLNYEYQEKYNPPIKKYKVSNQKVQKRGVFFAPRFLYPFHTSKGGIFAPFDRLLYFLEGRRVDQIEHDDLIAACLHCGTAAAEGGNRIAQRLTLEGIV